MNTLKVLGNNLSTVWVVIIWHAIKKRINFQIPGQTKQTYSYVLYSIISAHGLRFVVVCCGLLSVYFTHIPQDYFAYWDPFY